MLHAGNIMATTKLMVGIVLLSLLGVLSHWGLGCLERPAPLPIHHLCQQGLGMFSVEICAALVHGPNGR